MRSFAYFLVVVWLAACDITGPDTETVELSFCGQTLWAGIQHDGGQDFHTIATGPGTVRVRTTRRVVIGQIRQGAGFPAMPLELYYLTREQAAATFVCGGDGAGQVSGTVSGITQPASVIVGTRAKSVTPQSPEFTLTDVATAPVDLVALYRDSAIVRHGMSYTDGGIIPVLDFGSNEAFPLQESIFTIPSHVTLLRWESAYVSARGTRILLRQRLLGGICCLDDSLPGVPEDRLAQGDMHQLLVEAAFGNGDVRTSERFYSTPGDQTVSFGPPAAPASVTLLSANNQLFRVDVPVQPDYGGQIKLIVIGGISIGPGVWWHLYASAEYRGSSDVWSLTVPNRANTLLVDIPKPRQVIATPNGAPWGYERSSREGDVYLSATGRTTSSP